ncbi:MAG: hypothetical protein H0V68_03795, partial [Actinobacteria bacterium]|nr:hypothetical protein [Actinomycetota bacterium]
PEWASLVKRALDDRPNPWLRVHQATDPDLATRTLAFARYAGEWPALRANSR